MIIERGFRDKLDKYINPAEDFSVELGISGTANYDFSCFGVDANNILSDERYMIFYNQVSSPENAITYSAKNNGALFTINLAKLPFSINKLVFTASIDGAGTMGEIASHSVSISQGSSEAVKMELSGKDFRNEKAIISIEIYHKESSWRFAGIANGFNGGLSDLLKFYGGEEAEDTHTTNQPQTQAETQTQTPENIPVISSGRVELRKGQKVQLDKKLASRGEVLINLKWNNASKSSGLTIRRKADKSIDLDIGCLYELTDGKRGSIQALGNKFGSLDKAPYIALDKDDRTGSAPDGENLRINASRISQIKRVLVYTFIYEGVNNWQEADGVATIKCPGSSELIIKLDEYDTNKIMCALVMLENVNNETFSAEKIIKFFDGHIALDEAYGWGLKWVHGTKSLQISE